MCFIIITKSCVHLLIPLSLSLLLHLYLCPVFTSSPLSLLLSPFLSLSLSLTVGSVGSSQSGAEG